MRKNRCTIKLIDHRLLISQFNPSIMATIFDLHLPIQSVIITSKLASSFLRPWRSVLDNNIMWQKLSRSCGCLFGFHLVLQSPTPSKIKTTT